MKAYFKQRAAYNRWANARLYQVAQRGLVAPDLREMAKRG
jgi:uncharacterized damage-inducible protein DinB